MSAGPPLTAIHPNMDDPPQQLADLDHQEDQLVSKERETQTDPPFTSDGLKNQEMEYLPNGHNISKTYMALNKFYVSIINAFLSECSTEQAIDLASFHGIPVVDLLKQKDDDYAEGDANDGNPLSIKPPDKIKAIDIEKLGHLFEKNLRFNNEPVFPQARGVETTKIITDIKTVKRTKSKKSKKSKKRGQTNKSGNYPQRFPLIATSVYKKAEKLTYIDPSEEQLAPGRDKLITIKIYSRFDYEKYQDKMDDSAKDLFYHDVMVSGRHNVYDFVQRFVCSENNENCQNNVNAFLFIKNVFYIDERNASVEQANAIRNWCETHKINNFIKRDMRCSRFEDLDYDLGRAELYVHNSTCEHVIIFSAIRLLDIEDPQLKSSYPRISAIPYDKKEIGFCYNCPDHYSQWIVHGSMPTPFNTALYCHKCYKKLLFDDEDKQICKFRAYPYRVWNLHKM